MGYIYTITSLKKHDIGYGINRLVYVGSCKDYDSRFASHKRDCFNPNSHNHDYKLYKIIRKIGWDNFVCEVIEVCDDDITDKDLLFREQHYIDKYDSKKSMNTNDAITGIDMVEYHRLYDAEYYKKNRDKIDERSKKWRNNNRGKYNEIQRKCNHKRKLWKKTITDFCNITIYE